MPKRRILCRQPFVSPLSLPVIARRCRGSHDPFFVQHPLPAVDAMPAFLFGQVLHGWAGRAIYIGPCLLDSIGGVGLLKMRRVPASLWRDQPVEPELRGGAT
jgi:hypothetical protein